MAERFQTKDPNSLRILFLCVSQWLALERLPLLFHEAGFSVAVISNQGTGLDLLPWNYQLNWRRDTASKALIEKAIEEFDPHLLILLDEPSVQMMSHMLQMNHGNFVTRHRSLLERSFGNLTSFPHRGRRGSLTELPAGVKVAATIRGHDPEKVMEFGHATAWNCVFKTEGSASGVGVIRSDDKASFKKCLQLVSAQKHVFVVQHFIRGRVAMRNAAALRGSVLCGMSLEKVESNGPFGYSTVVKALPHAGMDKVAAQVAATWGISGFFSCDFVIDPEGVAWLIEVNSRPTSVMHLGYCMGVDFVQAAEDIVRGDCRIQAEKLVIERPVALFPKEWLRSPSSTWLTTADNDIPWKYPNLLEHYKKMLPQDSWIDTRPV